MSSCCAFDDRVVLAQAPELTVPRLIAFEESFYLAHNPDVAEAVAFDEAYYLSHKPDVAAAVERGEFHSGYEYYAMYGQSEGRSVSDSTPTFDEAFYLAQNPDVAAAIQAGDIFDAYTCRVPDVAAAGIDSLMHLLTGVARRACGQC